MRAKRILFWAVFPIALLMLSVALRTRDHAHSAAGFRPAASAPPRIAQSVAEHERLLEEKQIEMITAKVIEGVSAKLSEASIPGNPELADSSRAAEPLKRDLTQLRKEVKDLTDFTQRLSLYTKEIEHSLASIDTGLSTPSVLRNKLNQQQNGLKP